MVEPLLSSHLINILWIIEACWISLATKASLPPLLGIQPKLCIKRRAHMLMWKKLPGRKQVVEELGRYREAGSSTRERTYRKAQQITQNEGIIFPRRGCCVHLNEAFPFPDSSERNKESWPRTRANTWGSDAPFVPISSVLVGATFPAYTQTGLDSV